METKSAFHPSNFMLIPTASCQASCVYCFGPNRGDSMSRDIVDKTLEFMARIAPREGHVHVTFHGGEPLLAGIDYYEYILPRLTHLFGKRLRLSMQTNLLALDEQMAEIIRSWNIRVGTSADGDEALCDAQRGKGYAAANERGRALLKQKGVGVDRICTLTHQSANEASRVFRYYAGESPLTGQPYSLHGAVQPLERPKSDTAVTAADMEHILLDTLELYRRNPEQTRVSSLDSMAKGCFLNAGQLCTFSECLGAFAAIAPDGEVYSCQRFCGFKQFSLGNVEDARTEETILQSPAFQMLYSKQENAKKACDNCNHFSYCHGGCLYNMFASQSEKDPYCEAYRAVFDLISRDMAREMGGLLCKLIVPENAPLLQMAGDQPHAYDVVKNKQRLRQIMSWGKYPYGVNQSLTRYKENRVSTLNKLYLHVTFDCPLQCDHCYAAAGSGMPEMPANEALSLVCEAQRALFSAVVITGGEPLIHSELDLLLEGLRVLDRKGMRLILRTSLGFPVEDNRLRAVCEAFPEIVVSIDGDEASHDRRRGKGRYAQTVVNLERIRDLGLIDRVGICATLPSIQRDGHEGQAVRALCTRLGIVNIRFRPVLPLGRAVDATPDEDFSCMDESDATHSIQPHFSCGLGQNLYVEPDGGTYPCYAWCGKDHYLGNVIRDGLRTILDGTAFHDLSHHDVDTNEQCKSCDVRYLCGGVCKAWAQNKKDIDGGGIDCLKRKEHFMRILVEMDQEG